MAAILIHNGNRGLLSETEIVYPTMPKGVPTPDTEEGYRWWEEKAYKNLNKAVLLLGNIEALGFAWATTLADELIEEMS